MSNVIMFPKNKKGSPPQSMEELLENVETTRKEHAEFIVDDIMQFAFGREYEEGFDLADEKNVKSTALLVESLRAALYNSVGIEHPFHALAESVFIHESEAASIVAQTMEEDNETE